MIAKTLFVVLVVISAISLTSAQVSFVCLLFAVCFEVKLKLKVVSNVTEIISVAVASSHSFIEG